MKHIKLFEQYYAVDITPELASYLEKNGFSIMDENDLLAFQGASRDSYIRWGGNERVNIAHIFSIVDTWNTKGEPEYILSSYILVDDDDNKDHFISFKNDLAVDIIHDLNDIEKMAIDGFEKGLGFQEILDNIKRKYTMGHDPDKMFGM